jgi:hypothetical protein
MSGEPSKSAAPVSAVLGVVTAYQRPGNIVGLLLTLVGLTEAVTAARDVGWWYLAERRPQALPSLNWLAAVTDQSAVWGDVLQRLPKRRGAKRAVDVLDCRANDQRWWDPPPQGTGRAPVREIQQQQGDCHEHPWAPLPAPLQLPLGIAFVGARTLARAAASAGSRVASASSNARRAVGTDSTALNNVA